MSETQMLFLHCREVSQPDAVCTSRVGLLYPNDPSNLAKKAQGRKLSGISIYLLWFSSVEFIRNAVGVYIH